MLEKIKNVASFGDTMHRTEEQAKRTLNQVEYLNKELAVMKDTLGHLQQEMTTLTGLRESLMGEMRESMDLMKATAAEFQEDLTDFKLIKGNLQGQFMEKITEDFRKEMAGSVGQLQADVKQFNELKQTVGSVASRTVTLSERMDTLIQVSKSIRKEDFQMGKVAQQISAADSEKLKLMKKVDILERLLSKERRKAYQQTIR